MKMFGMIGFLSWKIVDLRHPNITFVYSMIK